VLHGSTSLIRDIDGLDCWRLDLSILLSLRIVMSCCSDYCGRRQIPRSLCSVTGFRRQIAVREGTAYHIPEFAFFYHLVGHPYTYFIDIMLREKERMLNVNEGCIKAYKDSAVVVVGLLRDPRVRWRSRIDAPFFRFEFGGPVERVFPF
jgi:hypothetical protein